MLSVAVDDEDVLAGRTPDAGLDGGAVALVVGVTHDDGACFRRAGSGIVGRPVVDDDDLVPVGAAPQCARRPRRWRRPSLKAGTMTDVVDGGHYVRLPAPEVSSTSRWAAGPVASSIERTR